jgi:mannose-6-phosphate isomerase-like protein (cupin superfamily)
MKNVVPLMLVSIVAGYLGGLVTESTRGGDRASAQGTSTRDPAFAQGTQAGQASAGRQGLPPSIAPVPNPPLYPDPLGEVVHWTGEQLRTIYDARVEAGRSGRSTNEPRFQSLSLRTHNVGLFFRVKFDSPRPANRSGIVSLVDDADQHEGVTDFYVMAGGSGQMVTDGVIENRQYGHNPRGSAESGAKTTVVFPGEFNGQPIRDGHVYDVTAGDWLAIPPGVPHWPGYNPGNGLMYVGVKINIGLYGTNVMY